MDTNASLRSELLALIGSNAHMGFADAVANFPPAHYNTLPPYTSYTPWQLLEHLRITQRDSLDYILDPNYQEIIWPAAYWPAKNSTTDNKGWNKTVNAFTRDLTKLTSLISNSKFDLFAPIPSNPKHSILRSVLIIADHNAYHIGEFASLRQVMQTWPKNRNK